MLNLIVAIVIYLILLLLASLPFLLDNNLRKRFKWFIFIVVLIGGGLGIVLETSKYYADKDRDAKIDSLTYINSHLDTEYNSLNANYSNLNDNYKNLKDALNDSHLSYDSITKTLINVNTGMAFINPKNFNAAPNFGAQQIGDYNTQNNNFAPKPREVSKDFIAKILKDVPNKGTFISIFPRNNETETIGYCNKIDSALTKNGYNNIAIQGVLNEQVYGETSEERVERLTEMKMTLSEDKTRYTIIVPMRK
jgi:hypothetical protein